MDTQMKDRWLRILCFFFFRLLSQKPSQKSKKKKKKWRTVGSRLGQGQNIDYEVKPELWFGFYSHLAITYVIIMWRKGPFSPNQFLCHFLMTLTFVCFPFCPVTFWTKRSELLWSKLQTLSRQACVLHIVPSLVALLWETGEPLEVRPSWRGGSMGVSYPRPHPAWYLILCWSKRTSPHPPHVPAIHISAKHSGPSDQGWILRTHRPPELFPVLLLLSWPQQRKG